MLMTLAFATVFLFIKYDSLFNVNTCIHYYIHKISSGKLNLCKIDYRTIVELIIIIV